jgi:GntR family transcriptional regulator
MIEINPSDAVPIWKQIGSEVRRLVAGGVFACGGAVPSVRDLARELRVNPATVARAYQELADEGLLVVRRGEGTYVAEELPAVAGRERRRLLHDAAARYASVAITAGAGAGEAIEALRDAFEKMVPQKGGAA